MTLLLDSHILLWYDKGDSRLPQHVLGRIRQPQSRVVVSVVTIWELSIKRSTGKLPGTGPISEMVKRNHFETLPVLPEHAEGIIGLPRHHGDPFDHLLIAQALHEGFTLVTHDKIIALYGAPVLLV